MEVLPSPATRALLLLAGFDADQPCADRAHLGYRVADVVTALGNGIHTTHGAEVHDGAWPVEAEMAAALRAALPEWLDHYAGASLAYALVRSGERDAAVIAALHPWDRLAFDWRARGLTSADVDARIQAAGFETLTPESRATVDGWLADPLTAMRNAFCDVPQLLGERTAYATLRTDDYTPEHGELFSALLASAQPPVDVGDVRQRQDDGPRWIQDPTPVYENTGRPALILPVLRPREGACWIVEYELDGATHAFEAAMAGGTWMDVAAVLAHVDALMQRLGRPDRVAQFECARGASPEWGFFALHDEAAFAALARDLGWPLVDRTKVPDWSAAAPA